ncbi:MAG: Rpn family recombination-promoting nuclease/putative transposase, partial [Defluviitaleaceae bacterium]|nr:Rpn family recombination-promoting nuclease/putative transposase [Defluviitaleaceae bacterium]
LEKQTEDGKLSILDIVATLDDSTTVLIEMHLYGVHELKFKTIRSWACAYAKWLKTGAAYSTQPPVICVSFINEPIEPQNINEIDKLHKCCKIADISTGEIFSDALELHYINMKAYANALKSTDGNMTMLEKWLAVLTEKELADKNLIKTICGEEEEINMAVSTLVRLSADAPTQEEYRKWREERDEQERRVRELLEQKNTIFEQGNTIFKHENTIFEQGNTILSLEKSNAENVSALAEKDSALAEKDSALAEAKNLIAELLAELGRK